MRKSFLLILMVLLFGCAKKRPATPADYYSSTAYQNREVLGVQESPDDVNFYETMKKAEAQATSQALAELAQQLSEFLATPDGS